MAENTLPIVKGIKNRQGTVLAEFFDPDPSSIESKQDTLVSGSNIKTINGQSILGAGNIAIEGGGETVGNKIQNNDGTSFVQANNADGGSVSIYAGAGGIGINSEGGVGGNAVDLTPTEGSYNLVQSNGVAAALAGKANKNRIQNAENTAYVSCNSQDQVVIHAERITSNCITSLPASTGSHDLITSGGVYNSLKTKVVQLGDGEKYTPTTEDLETGRTIVLIGNNVDFLSLKEKLNYITGRQITYDPSDFDKWDSHDYLTHIIRLYDNVGIQDVIFVEMVACIAD